MIHEHCVRRRHSTLSVLALLLGLAGCAGAPEQPAPAPAPSTAQEKPVDRPPPSTPRPSGAISPHATVHALAEARLLEGDWPQARQILASLPETLPANERAWRDYYLAWAHWLQGEDKSARDLFDTASNAATEPLLQLRISNLARHVATLGGDDLRAAHLAIRQLEFTSDPLPRAGLLREGWRALLRLSESERQSALESAEGDWRGWLELAGLERPDRSGAAMGEQLQDWLQRHPEHPAATMLPGGLGFLRVAHDSPSQVTLLLPLTGELSSAANAIRDGYLAQHYLARGDQAGTPHIRIIDTSDFADATSAYRQAVADGAELVIGPLNRDAVNELAALTDRPVPVLALNRSTVTAEQSGAAFLQLSLAPEDEMRQLAERAWGKGARRALVIRPAGERGARLTEALTQGWQQLGGTLADAMVYSSAEGWSEELKSALHLQASEQRAREMRAMLGTRIEHTPRRRQDVDAIFLLADSAAEARSLRPLLAFHYAGALPVYAPSSVYTGQPDNRDRDLDGVQLIELPWLLGANPRARVALTAGSTGSDGLPRLNALGADAWLLQSRLAQLQAGPDTLLRGNTGLLTLDEQLRVLREALPARFDGSELRPQ